MKNLKGKKIKEIMDKNTVVCNGDILSDDWVDTVIGYIYEAGTVDENKILHDEYNIFIFNSYTEKLKAMFHVYEIHSVIINKERGLLTVAGHESIHHYWFDNGEYSEEHTR